MEAQVSMSMSGPLRNHNDKLLLNRRDELLRRLWELHDGVFAKQGDSTLLPEIAGVDYRAVSQRYKGVDKIVNAFTVIERRLSIKACFQKWAALSVFCNQSSGFAGTPVNTLKDWSESMEALQLQLSLMSFEHIKRNKTNNGSGGNDGSKLKACDHNHSAKNIVTEDQHSTLALGFDRDESPTQLGHTTVSKKISTPMDCAQQTADKILYCVPETLPGELINEDSYKMLDLPARVKLVISVPMQPLDTETVDGLALTPPPLPSPLLTSSQTPPVLSPTQSSPTQPPIQLKLLGSPSLPIRPSSSSSTSSPSSLSSPSSPSSPSSLSSPSSPSSPSSLSSYHPEDTLENPAKDSGTITVFCFVAAAASSSLYPLQPSD